MVFNSDWVVRASQGIVGEGTVPGDKSISHRAVMLSAISEHTVHIHGFLFGADNLCTVAAFRHLGVLMTLTESAEQLTVEGVGLYGLQASACPLDMGNSGTAMRLLTGLLAGQRFSSTLIGDASLSRRPMRRVVDPLCAMGAVIRTTAEGTAPIHIEGGHRLCAIDYSLPVPSAQIHSALVLAGLYATGEMHIMVPGVIRDHTQRMMEMFALHKTSGRVMELFIPGDLSSAAFFIVAATITPNSAIVLRNVGINPTRTGLIDLLILMGADIRLVNPRCYGEEPIADIYVRSASLHAVDIGPEYVPRAMDEIPVLCIAAACATGVTRLHGAAELRVKESDRLCAMHEGLSALGIFCEAFPDGLSITGGVLTGGAVRTHGDHRIAMAFAVAGCVAQNPVMIDDCENVHTSFPHFVRLATQLGLDIRVHE